MSKRKTEEKSNDEQSRSPDEYDDPGTSASSVNDPDEEDKKDIGAGADSEEESPVETIVAAAQEGCEEIDWGNPIVAAKAGDFIQGILGFYEEAIDDFKKEVGDNAAIGDRIFYQFRKPVNVRADISKVNDGYFEVHGMHFGIPGDGYVSFEKTQEESNMFSEEDVERIVARVITGLVGQAGLAGFAGQAGMVGQAGLAGFAGQAGMVGQAGLAGFAGQAGMVGQAGLAGFAGQAGMVGQAGLAGFAGQAGMVGQAGLAGFAGQAGMVGQAGLAGFARVRPEW